MFNGVYVGALLSQNIITCQSLFEGKDKKRLVLSKSTVFTRPWTCVYGQETFEDTLFISICVVYINSVIKRSNLNLDRLSIWIVTKGEYYEGID